MIRKYQDHDLNSLLELWYRASHLAHPFLDESFLRQERETIASVYMPRAETWVYARQGDVVGFISLLGNEVGGLFVDPTVQREGIGRALMDHARLLRGELEVEVFKANSIGRRFYDRYGFVFVKEHVDEQTGQPVLRMRLGGS
jgi:putative acetyltransferase